MKFLLDLGYRLIFAVFRLTLRVIALLFAVGVFVVFFVCLVLFVVGSIGWLWALIWSLLVAFQGDEFWLVFMSLSVPGVPALLLLVFIRYLWKRILDLSMFGWVVLQRIYFFFKKR